MNLDAVAAENTLRRRIEFAVDGTAIPDVDFDIGESYAGLLPISSAANETRQLFFWYATCRERLLRSLTQPIGSFPHPILPQRTRSSFGTYAEHRFAMIG